MLKKVAISMTVERYGVSASLFDEVADALDMGEVNPSLLDIAPNEDGTVDEPEQTELFTAARLRLNDTEFSLSYEESALTGMEGTESQLSFHRAEPGLVTMLRTGSVKTALVFEKGKRHLCVYQTPYMPFEVCVYTLDVNNQLLDEHGDPSGTLELDYIVEIHGARAERCRMKLDIREM